MDQKEIRFINVDLDLESQHSIDALVGAFENSAWVLHYEKNSTPQFARIEAATEQLAHNPDAIINHLCDLVDHFPKAALKQWLSCNRRTFDIGLQSGVAPKVFNQSLKADTLLRLSALGASLEITLYPIE